MRVSLVMVSGGAGGLQQSIIPYATALRHFGHQVQIIMNVKSPLVKDVERRGFIPQLVAGMPQFPTTSYFGVRRNLRLFSPEIVIGFASKGYSVARLAASRTTPVYSRVGSMNPRRIRRLLKADALLVTTEQMRDLVIRSGAQSSRVEIVPNFLIEDITPHNHQPTDVVRIGAMGRLVHRKGFDLLLRAVHLLRQNGQACELIIAGSGQEYDALQKLSVDLNLPVKWLGWVDNESKKSFFDAIDIFVCPSRDEPFGQIYLEAMRASIPIVSSETVGSRAIFIPGQNGLICRQEDPEDMAKQVEILAKDHELRDKIGRAGADTFRQSYLVSTAGSQLCDALTTLLGRHSPNARH